MSLLKSIKTVTTVAGTINASASSHRGSAPCADAIPIPMSVICQTMIALRVDETPRKNHTIAKDIAAADATIMMSRKMAPASEFEGSVNVSMMKTTATPQSPRV